MFFPPRHREPRLLGPASGVPLPTAFHLCVYPHPRAQVGATEELQAAAEDPTKWPLPGRPPLQSPFQPPYPQLAHTQEKEPAA